MYAYPIIAGDRKLPYGVGDDFNGGRKKWHEPSIFELCRNDFGAPMKTLSRFFFLFLSPRGNKYKLDAASGRAAVLVES